MKRKVGRVIEIMTTALNLPAQIQHVLSHFVRIQLLFSRIHERDGLRPGSRIRQGYDNGIAFLDLMRHHD